MSTRGSRDRFAASAAAALGTLALDALLYRALPA